MTGPAGAAGPVASVDLNQRLHAEPGPARHPRRRHPPRREELRHRPVLTHGDLWHANVVAADDGAPALVDPAVSYTRPDVDLSMCHASAATSEQSARFHAAHAEIRPLGDD